MSGLSLPGCGFTTLHRIGNSGTGDGRSKGTTVREVTNSFGKRIPLLEKEGWTRHKKNAAKPPLKGADGVVIRGTYSIMTTPSAPSKEASRNLLNAQPPLLSQEGNPFLESLTSSTNFQR